MTKKGMVLSDKETRAIASFVLTSYIISTIINIICIASIATYFVYNNKANADKVSVPVEVLEVIE